MEVGIGVPNSVRGTTGAQLLEWARRADAAGFSSLASIGAVSYPAYEELTVFAAAGAVTERIRFLPNVLIAPARSTAELAKQAATVQELTGGRLTLGLGVGWREADYTLTGRDFAGRGAAFDRQLADLRRAWAGEALAEGTRPVAPEAGRPGVPILVGDNTEAAVRRTVEHGIGWTAGTSRPRWSRPSSSGSAPRRRRPGGRARPGSSRSTTSPSGTPRSSPAPTCSTTTHPWGGRPPR